MSKTSHAIAAPSNHTQPWSPFKAIVRAVFGLKTPTPPATRQVSSPARKAPPVQPTVKHLNGAQLRQMAANCTLLKKLRRSGLRLTRMDRFTKEEKSLAQNIGDNIRFLNSYLRTLRYAVAETKGKLKYWLPKKANGPLTAEDWKIREHTQRALQPLVHSGVFAEDPGFGRSRDSKSSTAHKFWEHSIANNKASRFVNGDWLACYADLILVDQFKRQEREHESLCQLTVDIPKDMVVGEIGARSRVEFDVLARVKSADGKDRILWIECKSGSAERIYAGQLIGAKKAVENVLSGIGSDGMELHMICLTLPPPSNKSKHLLPMQTLGAQLENEGISLVTVDQLRPWVAQNLA